MAVVVVGLAVVVVGFAVVVVGLAVVVVVGQGMLRVGCSSEGTGLVPQSAVLLLHRGLSPEH